MVLADDANLIEGNAQPKKGKRASVLGTISSPLVGAISNRLASADSDIATVPSPPDIRTEEGFRWFLDEASNKVFRFFVARRVPIDEAEDLCQETFLTLWRNRHRARPDRLESFALGIACRILRAYQRKNQAQRRTLSLDTDTVAEPTSSFQEQGEESEPRLSSVLHRALENLPLRQRQVIDLVWLKSFTRSKAAQRLGIAESTLRVHESRAVDQLRHVLIEDTDG